MAPKNAQMAKVRTKVPDYKKNMSTLRTLSCSLPKYFQVENIGVRKSQIQCKMCKNISGSLKNIICNLGANSRARKGQLSVSSRSYVQTAFFKGDLPIKTETLQYIKLQWITCKWGFGGKICKKCL